MPDDQITSGLPAVFVDRDGTLIEEVGCLDHPSKVSVLPGSADAVARLNAAGRPVIAVTNQAWVARGMLTHAEVEAVNASVVARFEVLGARIDAVYFCPHHPTDGEDPWRRDCSCRKPAPGMLIEAADTHGLDLAASVVVGDLPSDIALAAAVGARGVLVRTGFGADQWTNHRHRFTVDPHLIADDLAAAVDWILRTDPPVHAERT